jgi:uncharacterized protein YjiK
VFAPVRERRLSIRGASAVACIPGALLVVEDDEGIFRVERARASLWAGRELHPALGDLEGLAVDEANRRVWALAEEDGTVIALSLATRSPRATVVGHLPRPRKRKNKGFEGLAFMPARVSPSRRASLVAVHEGKPRRVGVFALPDLEPTHDLKLPDEAKDLLDDLADVTVDPVTGLLLLLSDQSQRIAIVRIVRGSSPWRAATSCRWPTRTNRKVWISRRRRACWSSPIRLQSCSSCRSSGDPRLAPQLPKRTTARRAPPPTSDATHKQLKWLSAKGGT